MFWLQSHHLSISQCVCGVLIGTVRRWCDVECDRPAENTPAAGHWKPRRIDIGPW